MSSDPRPPFWFVAAAVLVVALSQYSLTSLYSSNAALAGKNATFVAVTDSDFSSRDGTNMLWTSHAQIGVITRDAEGRFSVDLEDTTRSFTSKASVKGRSMELSAIQYYEDQLLAFCDRTGFMFELDLVNGTSTIHTQLITGPGDTGDFFKSEWVALKDGTLVVGSNGKEWVNKDGEVEHTNLQWVKIFENGVWRHEHWVDHYSVLREAADATFPGYMIHESVVWDVRKNQWYFVPRKISNVPYDEHNDEVMSANTLFTVSEDFSEIRTVTVGPLERKWGFTAVKPLPMSLQSGSHTEPTVLIGIKAMEFNGVVDSKFTIFDTTGKILLNTDDGSLFQSIGIAHKFEGLAFLPKVLTDQLEVSY